MSERHPLDSVLSHDLRARLRAVTGFLEIYRIRLAEADTEPDDEAEAEALTRYLDLAAEAAAQADRLTERVVRHIRLETADVDLQPTDLHRLVTDAVAYTEVQPPPPTDVSVEVLVDERLFTEALREVVDNARRYTKPGTAPDVSTKVGAENGWATVVISDAGTGIRPERIHRAFDLCQQLHDRTGTAGAGMGLPIVRRIMRRHGGDVSLRAEFGVGTMVELRLPLPAPTNEESH